MGTVPSGAQVSVDLALLAERPGLLESEVEVSSPRLDALLENNQAQIQASVEPPLLLPVSLAAAGPHYENAFVGLALFNPLADLNEVLLTGLSLQGERRQEVVLPAMALQAQTAFLTSEQLSDPTVLTLQAEGLTLPVQGFFLVGDPDLGRMDGLGGRLDEHSLFHFPLLDGSEDARTLLFLHNPGPGQARLTAVLRSPAGQELASRQRDLAPQGSLLADLQDWLGLPAPLQASYLSVESDLPLRGFELISDEGTLTALAAQPSQPTQRLLAPHYFVDSEGGSTVLHLLNLESESVLLNWRAFDDNGAEAASQQRELSAGSLLVEDLGQWIQPPEGGIATGHVVLEAMPLPEAPSRPVDVLGAVSFQGQGFRSMLPLVAQGRLESLILQVAQSAEAGIFTGCALLNPGDQVSLATLRAFDQSGRLSAERLVEIPPGARLVGLLDSQAFFGPGFEQLGGRFEVSSDQPLVSFALFGDYRQNYLAAVESQEVLR